MQVKATVSQPVPAVSIACDKHEFDRATGPVAAFVAPQMPLALPELVTALLMCDLTTADLAAMDEAEVRHEVGFTLALAGLMAVRDAITVHLDRAPIDVEEREHRALCHARVASAFGVAVTSPTGPRVASRSIGGRSTTVRAAAA